MIDHNDDDRIDVHGGTDTDDDGYPDTLLVPGRPELMFAVDTDRDEFADLVIEIGADAVARRFPLVAGATDPLADACYATSDPQNPDDATDDASHDW
jgi:hypothetical protein